MAPIKSFANLLLQLVKQKIRNSMKPAHSQIATESFSQWQTESSAHFKNHFLTSHLWHLLPEGNNNLADSVGILNSQTNQSYCPANVLKNFLSGKDFVFLTQTEERNKINRLALLDTSNKYLWSNTLIKEGHTADVAKETLKNATFFYLKDWKLPLKEQLYKFASNNNNPYREGPRFRLRNAKAESTCLWLTQGGRVDVDEGCWTTIAKDGIGYVFAFNDFLKEASHASILKFLADHRLGLQSLQGESFPDFVVHDFSIGMLMKQCHEKKMWLKADTNDETPINLSPSEYMINQQLELLDYTPCRQPKLDPQQLSDISKGLWELWGEDDQFLKQEGLVARAPHQDVQHRAVAIDFGTSSTVVAMDTLNGHRELLRIGVRDFYQPIEAQHFENPTVIEALDFEAFNKIWTTETYRPSLNWDWMRAAHEAQANFRDNPGDTRILASILPKLKQWALRSDQTRIRLTDRKGHEIELSPHTEKNPVRGIPLTVSAADAFDPIELYAWYLGMAINWRGRGLFLKYYLSFPAKYPREIKDRILASFRRGLQRSLPKTLITSHPDILNEFEVCDLASEPAAYAAAALPSLKIQPTEVGVPYAVFDFGGGTTDFDFGLYRWASPEEEKHGYEQVFEHLNSSGDNYLGGENLLEHLVYESFKHNLETLRNNRIQFSKPIDASFFSGSEAFIAQTQAAQTNSIMLAAKLRAFLEGENNALNSQIKLDLININNDKATCEISLDAEALDNYLRAKIQRGVEAFLTELVKIAPSFPKDEPIHLLLAGNGSRSRHIKHIFSNDELWSELLEKAFTESPPEIIIHPPLPVDENNPHAPTSKTGVALGLLQLVPGENTLTICHLDHQNDGEAPFSWSVGKLRRGVFQPLLSPGAQYGVWKELGPLQQGVFNLFSSNSPRAQNQMEQGDPELRKQRLDFPSTSQDEILFIRATGPEKIQISTKDEHGEIDLKISKTIVLS